MLSRSGRASRSLALGLVSSVSVLAIVAGCSVDIGSVASLDDAASDASGVAVDGGISEEASSDDAAPEASPPKPVVYVNPVFAKDFPDPYVMRVGGTYYAFATNAAGKNVRTAKSTDLATWTELPDALPTLPSWAKSNASLTWAPSAFQRGSSFVLYFTARDVASDFQCIGRAVSSTPEGPYVDDASAPFVCQTSLCGSIDPSPFLDENGDAYLLWKSDENAAECGGDAKLFTQRLGIDGISLVGSPTVLLVRDRNWEHPLIEGPSMVKRNDKYFLFYSAAWWESPNYGIGYAVCSSPVGPCTKKTLDGPLVGSANGALGPGGQEIFDDGAGNLWMAYHAWSAPAVGYGNGGARSLRVDPLTIVGETPSFVGPTTTPRSTAR